jgi:nitroimidazol reductase NimA-like FMN-containing flavoprotein (pyridoxamine 5'-phosphate oxidase superfamily)
MDQRSWQMADMAAGGEGVTDDRWHELTKSECFALLAGQHIGRVVLADERGPAAFPVNFVIDRHTVLFRTDEGTKLKIAGIGGRVAFEVDETDQETRSGWSVLVRGEAVEVTDPDELTRVRTLALFPWAPGAKNRYVRILPSSLSGRRISPRSAASDWWG